MTTNDRHNNKAKVTLETRKSTRHGDLDKNKEVDMEMDDSFTCSMASQALAMATNKLNGKLVPKSQKSRDKVTNLGQAEVELNDSLTFSMIVKAMDSESEQEYPAQDRKTNKGSSNTSPRKEKKGENRNETSKVNSKMAPVFSPDTMGVMNQICGDTPGRKAKPAPKKCTKRKNNHETKGDICSPKQRKRTPTRKKSSNCREDSTLSTSRNDSTASDYVPPTPPDPNRTLGTKTPNRSNLTGRTESPALRKAKKECTKESPVAPRVKKPECAIRNNKSGENAEKNDMLDTSQPIPLTNQSFTIIDTAASKLLFNHFIDEWRRREMYALSLACEKIPPQPTNNVGHIGANFKKGIFAMNICST